MELVLDNKIIFNNKRINIGLPITFGLIGIGFLLGKLTKKVCNFGKNQEIEAKKDNDIAKDVTEVLSLIKKYYRHIQIKYI